jgi:hypothetical protein
MSRYSITAFWLAMALGLSVKTTWPSLAAVWQVGSSLGMGSSLLSLRGLGAQTSARQMRHSPRPTARVVAVVGILNVIVQGDLEMQGMVVLPKE